jgi:phosphatidylserine decarboxylase
MICRKTEIILKEGWGYLGVIFFFTVVFLFLGCTFLAFISILLLAFTAFVFRNPERVPDELDEFSLLSPIDGEVVYIGKVYEDSHYNKEMLKIAIKNTILDTSLVRNPLDLQIKSVESIHGLNLPIDSQKAKFLNERLTIVASCEYGDVLIRVLAGSCTRKIYKICENYKKVRKGDRNLILVNGEVELFLPLECRVKVVEGERVKAGESVLGYFLNDKQK